jgi:5-methylthioadenosine/S-adenosylhomocysteine deaminase
MDILIKNATIITQNSKREILKNRDILIEGNHIAKIGKDLKEKVEFIIEGKNKLVIPGLVNTHTHLAMTLFRGYADDADFWEAWPKRVWPREAKLKGNDVYWGSLLGCLEMIRSGTTCFADMYFFMEETAKAVKESGIRANLSHGMIDSGDAKKREKELAVGEKFVKDYDDKADGRIKCSFGPHAPYTCSRELLERTTKLSERYNVLVQIHVSETRKEVFDCIKQFGKRPVEYLDSINFLNERIIAAHCVWLTKKEIRILGEKGVKVSHNPVSNMKLAGGGVSPVQEMIDSNVCVTFGTDGAVSNNSLNLIETMKVGALLQKTHRWDARVLNAHESLDFATINGAKALRINSGSIEVGKLADMVLLNLKSPNLIPMHNLVSNIVYSTNPSNISDVIIDGRLIMNDGKILTLDEDKALERAQKVAMDFMGR